MADAAHLQKALADIATWLENRGGDELYGDNLEWLTAAIRRLADGDERSFNAIFEAIEDTGNAQYQKEEAARAVRLKELLAEEDAKHAKRMQEIAGNTNDRRLAYPQDYWSNGLPKNAYNEDGSPRG